ncbi:hypothetical protein RE409_12545 [Peribacillus sp. R9-11]|nr:hypothetical protein [Peribacillus sp. R9-11]WMX57965.1 hypothetical protein RE409_12545 [Peribacillus sp. R9-11]
MLFGYSCFTIKGMPRKPAFQKVRGIYTLIKLTIFDSVNGNGILILFTLRSPDNGLRQAVEEASDKP